MATAYVAGGSGLRRAHRSRDPGRVLRAKGVDALCAGRLRNSSDNCQLYAEEVGSLRAASFDDRPGLGNWTYRIGVSANWLNDLKLGDVYVVSPPLTVTVP